MGLLDALGLRAATDDRDAALRRTEGLEGLVSRYEPTVEPAKPRGDIEVRGGHLDPEPDATPRPLVSTRYGSFSFRYGEPDSVADALLKSLNLLLGQVDEARARAAAMPELVRRQERVKKQVFKGKIRPVAKAAEIAAEVRANPSTDVAQFSIDLKTVSAMLAMQGDRLQDLLKQAKRARTELDLTIVEMQVASIRDAAVQLREEGKHLQEQIDLFASLVKDAADFVVTLAAGPTYAALKLAIDAVGSVIGFVNENDFVTQAKKLEASANDLNWKQLSGRVAIARQEIADVKDSVVAMSQTYEATRELYETVRRKAADEFDKSARKGSFRFAEVEAARKVVDTTVEALRSAEKLLATIRTSYARWQPIFAKRLLHAEALNAAIGSRIKAAEGVTSATASKTETLRVSFNMFLNAAYAALLQT